MLLKKVAALIDIDKFNSGQLNNDYTPSSYLFLIRHSCDHLHTGVFVRLGYSYILPGSYILKLYL